MNTPDTTLSFDIMRNKVKGILAYSPFFQDFDRDTVKLLQTYFLWRHPDKFFFNDDEIHIVGGRVKVHMGRRFFQLKFSNHYVWLHEKTE